MIKNVLVYLGVLLCAVSFGQKTVTGKIFDAESKMPLQGASINGKGSSKGTQSGTDGQFTFTVPNDTKALLVSYVGYIIKEILLPDSLNNLGIALEKAESQTEIVITGSRNLSRTRIESAVPVDVIPVAQLVNEVGQIDVNQLLTYIAPSFQSSRQTISDGTDHIDPAQLRGLGSDQVLVLINGKRRHQSALVNVNGTVNRGQVGTDLSAIPATAIERIEVLRDGASAQYGSDAIAGVINIILKKTTNALTGNVSYGLNTTAYPRDFALNALSGKDRDAKTNVTDGQTTQVGLNYGFKLGKTGYLNLNGEYIQREPTSRTGTYTGAVYPNTAAGVNRDDSIMGARGLNRNFYDMRIGQSKIQSASVFANSRIELGKSWGLKLFGGYNKKNGEAAGFYRYPTSINSGAGSFRSAALAIYPNGFLPLIKTDIQDISFSAGIGGKLGKWDAELSNSFGYNIFDYTVDNSINYTQLSQSGSPKTKFDAGGIRFLQNTVNADMSRNFSVLEGLNIAFGGEYRTDQYEQVAGEEASYRNYNTASGAASGAQVFAGFTPQFAGKFTRSSVAVYSDNEVDITKNWMVSAAVRFENFSDFGNTLNYKIASRYKATSWLTFRAAHSTGFRAPSMQQRFYAKTNTLFVSVNGVLTPVESGTFPNGSTPANILGIPELKEETSKNYSAGLTLSPAKGLEITVDGYIVNIDNRIVLTNNFTGGNNPQLQGLLNAAGAQTANFFTNAIDTRSKGLETVVNYSFNIAKKHKFRVTAAAIFFENTVRDSANGKPIVYGSPTLTASGQIGNYFNREDESRIEVANPRIKTNLMISYKVSKFNTMLRFAYFGKVTYLDPVINPNNPSAWPVNAFSGNREILDQEFSEKMVTDLTAGYEITKNFTLSVGANNLFDVYQDKHKHSGNFSAGRFSYSRRVQQMGFNGRYLFTRLAFKF